MVRDDSDPAGTQRKTIMIIRNTLLPIAGAALLLAGLTANAQAYECLAQTWAGNGNAFVKGIALAAARGDWSNRVEASLHLVYSQYNLAEDKEESCTKTGRRYQCRVEAKPCAYVVQ